MSPIERERDKVYLEPLWSFSLVEEDAVSPTKTQITEQEKKKKKKKRKR